jgi:uncharacterized DUF497 family protein
MSSAMMTRGNQDNRYLVEGSTVEFEWDEDKRLSNVEKHGIDFAKARALFDGRPVTHLPSTYRDEIRTLAVGRIDGVFWTVVWTKRDERIRLISARRSRQREIALYLLEHADA